MQPQVQVKGYSCSLPPPERPLRDQVSPRVGGGDLSLCPLSELAVAGVFPPLRRRAISLLEGEGTALPGLVYFRGCRLLTGTLTM